MSLRSFTSYVVLCAPLLLAACGDGWNMERVNTFPYGNQRTAGSGVAYVLARMMPERELNLEPVSEEAAPSEALPTAQLVESVIEEPTAPPESDEALEDLREMFREDQVSK